MRIFLKINRRKRKFVFISTSLNVWNTLISGTSKEILSESWVTWKRILHVFIHNLLHYFLDLVIFVLFFNSYYHFNYVSEYSNKMFDLNLYCWDFYFKHMFHLNLKIWAACPNKSFMTKKKKKTWKLLHLFNFVVIHCFLNVVKISFSL